MSVIRKQPFIEKVIKSLSADDLVTLKTLINTNTVNTVYSIDNMPSDNGVYAADFMIESGKIYSSFLIKNASYTVVIAYHKYQDLSMFNIVNNEIKRVNEYLNINELRRIVDDCLVEEGVIGSGDADAGDVLTSDGEGGTDWKNPADSITSDKLEAGAIVSVFGFNADGEPVKGEIPSGSVVDAELDEDSTNPVQNKVVTAALDGKLGINSYSEGAGVGYADRASNIEPVSDDSGATQTEPFIMQGTGTANNTASVDTRPFAKLQEKRGNVVVVNQLCKSPFSGTGTTGDITLTDNNDGTLTAIVANTLASDVSITIANYGASAGATSGHKYYVSPQINNEKIGLGYQVYGYGIAGNIGQMTFSGSITLALIFKTGLSAGTYKITPILSDVDKWFNGNIPADLISNPSHFSWYYNGSLASNTGSLEASDGRYLVNTGRQLCDEVFETGSINNSTGQNEADSTNIRTKNYIICKPNVDYYISKFGNKNTRYYWYDINKNFISSGVITSDTLLYRVVKSPANAFYFRARSTDNYGTTYKNDFDFSLYYATGDGYDQHYSYKGLKEYDTGSEVLRSAGSVSDKKLPSGEIERNIGVVDLGTLNWNYLSNIKFYASAPSNAKFVGIYCPNFICAKYQKNNNIESFSNKQILIVNGWLGPGAKTINIYDNDYTDSAAFKAAMSGVYLFYELAESTTEQGTPFTEDIEVNDYGMMYWLDSSNKLISIPQGNKVFYPVDYVLFIDSLHKLVDGNAEAILNTEMSQADFDSAMNSFGYYKQEDLSSGITDTSGLTYSNKKAYKIGNMMFITIVARNSTGNTISAGSQLVSLGSGLYNASSGLVFRCDNGGTDVRCAISSSGLLSFGSNIENDAVIYINICYAVA